MRKSMSLTKDKVFADRENGDRYVNAGTHAFTISIKGYTEDQADKIIDAFESRMNTIIEDYDEFSMARCPDIDIYEDGNCEYSDTLVIIDEEIDTLKKEWKKFKKSENIKSILDTKEDLKVKDISEDLIDEELESRTCADCGEETFLIDGICEECLELQTYEEEQEQEDDVNHIE